MKLSGRNRGSLKGIPNQDHGGVQDDSCKSSGKSLKIELEFVATKIKIISVWGEHL